MNARLTGDPAAPRRRNPQLSLEMEEIILHALEREPSNRFPSAGAMREELNDYGEVDLTERSKRLRPPRLWKSRFRLLPAIALLVALQIAAFFVLFWLFNRPRHTPTAAPSARPGVVEPGLPSR
jgi:serine/threonine-protein kinase